MATTAMRSSPIPSANSNLPGSNNNNKRKRGPSEQEAGRNIKHQSSNREPTPTPAEYAHLLQEIDNLPDENTRTAQAALAAPMPQSAYPDPGPFEGNSSMPPSYGVPNSVPQAPVGDTSNDLYDPNRDMTKPIVGSNEWHKQRKDNHKEVERRRREVINEGIENIAKLVPGHEKNKGAVLQRTCQYITELQEKVKSFENERATFDIALRELTTRNDRMKDSAQRAWNEASKWQQRCRENGLQFDDYDTEMASLEDTEVLNNVSVA